MTVAQLIAYLQEISDPENTLVVLREDDVDEPCEFVALETVVGWT